jgi:2-haloacid dehalogenase
MNKKIKTSLHYEALIFDLFGVLVEFNDDLVSARLADSCACPVSAFRALRDIVSRGDPIRGRLTLDGLHDELRARHGLELSREAFETCWLKSYSRAMPGMEVLLSELARRHPLVLLSNVDKYYWRTLSDDLVELRHFDHRVLSWQTGVAKPEQQAFELAIKASGTSASRCFFIDDKAENVEAARELGMGAHLFVGVTALRQELEREGLL